MWRKYNIKVLTGSALDTFHIPMFRQDYNSTEMLVIMNTVLNVKI
jgi:hypothetical protein